MSKRLLAGIKDCKYMFCFSSFMFAVFALFWSLCSPRRSFVDVPLLFGCPADHVVPDWNARILLIHVLG